MSIEAKLDALIVALNANTAALTGGKAAPVPAGTPPKAVGKTEGLTYDDVKGPFLDLVKVKGRDAGVAVLKKLGAEKLPDIKPQDFAAMLAAIHAAGKTESALA